MPGLALAVTLTVISTISQPGWSGRTSPRTESRRWPPPWLTRDLLSDWDEDWLVLEPCLRHLLATAEELGEAAQAPE
jgi:hypothetical protein